MHPLWKGFLNFGLVSIPIKLFSAIKEKELEFHLFHKKDSGKIRYAKICVKDNKEVRWEDIIKGYEYIKNKFVYLDESDFEKAHLHKVNSIDILEFVKESEIDSILYEKPYFLAPDLKNEKPYTLLFEGLNETKKVAIARFVLHGKEHIAIIKPFSDILVMIQLRFIDELKNPKSIKTTKKTKSKKELNIAIKFIEELTTKFSPKEYKDTYKIYLKKLLLKKVKNQKIIPFGKKPIPTRESDIYHLIEKSLHSSKKKRRKIA
jgi:DNA end-binding protein Ku